MIRIILSPDPGLACLECRRGADVISRYSQQGEQILHEKPLFTVPPTSTCVPAIRLLLVNNQFIHPHTDITIACAAVTSSPVEFIQQKLALLTESQKQSFWNLSFVNFPKDKDPERDLDRVALAIFETNAVRAGEEVGIFPRMARLNHGCSSGFNSVYSYREREGTLYIHAIKGVKKGEVRRLSLLASWEWDKRRLTFRCFVLCRNSSRRILTPRSLEIKEGESV